MPELPEVETIKRGLEPLIVRKKIIKVDVDAATPKCFRGEPRRVAGAAITGIRRRGKALLIDLNNGYTFMIHLRMTGQLIWRDDALMKSLTVAGLVLSGQQSSAADKTLQQDMPLAFSGQTTPQISSGQKTSPASAEQITEDYDKIMQHQFAAGHPSKNFTAELPNKQTRVIFVFNDGKLYFNDQRKFGFVKVLPTSEVENDEFISKLAKEPWQMKPEELFVACARHKKAPIKAVLLDQQIIAGLGNIYADEACFYASVHPATPAGSLSEEQVAKLLEGACRVMDASIASGGSTMATYIKPDGTTGDYLELFAKVFRREGKPCERCGAIIEKTRVAGRGTHYCPHCQLRIPEPSSASSSSPDALRRDESLPSGRHLTKESELSFESVPTADVHRMQNTAHSDAPASSNKLEDNLGVRGEERAASTASLQDSDLTRSSSQIVSSNDFNKDDLGVHGVDLADGMRTMSLEEGGCNNIPSFANTVKDMSGKKVPLRAARKV